MKQLRTFIVIALALLICGNTYGWGRLCHRTIAEIAERNLTPKAKANIERYTKGTPLADYSLFLDEVAKQEPYKTEFRGWHASIANPNCKSPQSVRDEHRKGRDGVTAMNYFTELLKEREKLSDSTVLNAIKCIVHIIPDYHCPVHVRYTDCNNSGKFDVTFFGKRTQYHKVWDSGVAGRGRKLKPAQYKAYADMLNTLSPKQQRKITKGWAQEWFEAAARDVRPTIKTVKEGDILDQKWVDSQLPFGEDLMQKAGYRLAKALNTLFDK